MNNELVSMIVVLLALATVLKILWPVVQGIGKSLVEGGKVILTLVFIGGGLYLLGQVYFG
jgi:hypothetical protein